MRLTFSDSDLQRFQSSLVGCIGHIIKIVCQTLRPIGADLELKAA